MQHHDDVVVVLRNLFTPDSTSVIQVASNERLKSCNLLIQMGDVLFDDVGELLQSLGGMISCDREDSGQRMRGGGATHADLDWPIVEQSLSLCHCMRSMGRRQLWGSSPCGMTAWGSSTSTKSPTDLLRVRLTREAHEHSR